MNLRGITVTVASGTHIGRYEIRSQIGEGGMGEVYRARDTKLGRDVAVKVLPPALSLNAERLQRFEQEAQAAGALNHPNILAIHDVGTHGGAPFVVSELLEGETLRERMNGSALPARKAVGYGLQIARGLAAAHEKGIVHRDLKPENIFVTRDGHVKLLDFGLAKLMRRGGGREVDMSAPTLQVNTMPGQVMGTVGYMSPEQVRGEAVDHRTDIFAFGAVLYEMLTGRRAFQRKTAVETLNAILKEEPQELESVNGPIPPALGRVVSHCLEKKKEERFQSARDLSFDLETLSGLSTSAMTPAASAPAKPQWRPRPAIYLAALLAAVVVAAFFAGRKSGSAVGRQGAESAPPEFQRLTFRRGAIPSARFAPDGQTIIYTASWGGEQPQLFLTRPESPESRPLGLQDAMLLAVSSTGEMAILLHPTLPLNRAKGTLARMPMAGGAPRELLRDVRAADWSPDGKQLAVIREAGEKLRLEYPIGTVLYETGDYIDSPRVAPKGDLIAFIENWNNIVVIDLAGRKRVLSNKWGVVSGLGWSPSRDEIWFTASEVGWLTALYVSTLSGEHRLVARGPQALNFEDISSDGRLLLSNQSTRKGLLALLPGETQERDLSWLDWAHLADISDDGSALLFTEQGEGGGSELAVYLRKTDGSPAVRLGEGAAQALSPDGEWVLSILQGTPNRLVILPVGAGESKTLTDDKFDCWGAEWFPDGKRILVAGKAPGQGERSYILNTEGGALLPVTPEGVVARLISPDGKLLIAGRRRQSPSIVPAEGGEPRPIKGLLDGDDLIQWSADGRSIYVKRNAQDSAKVQISRLDLATGHRELWKEVVPDPTRLARTVPMAVTPDGKSYAYTYVQHNADLYQVKGLK
jgi:eukaryotic-like serine/threonine-protein kinase